MISAGKIVEHMEVIAADDIYIGTVDHTDGENRIKLTKQDHDD